MSPAILLLIASVAAAAPIAGITAKDAFPAACVGCHTGDMRLSRMMARWNGSVDAKTLAAMQAFAPKGLVLKGKHPPLAAFLKDIPNSCSKCHTAQSKTAPPLAPVMHGVHLAAGEAGRFVKEFQGECTHCHKLNKATGLWSIPSGAEK